ncbi:MAG: VOC family protein [Chitinophagales bacterium]
MRYLPIITLIITLLASCQTNSDKSNVSADVEEHTEKPVISIDTTTPKVTGIGGVFFYSDQPEKTKAWYSQNLGIIINDWGSSSFESRDINDSEKINSLQWKPFKTGDQYFSPSEQPFMINYQVQNIEALVSQLKENGVTILDSIVAYEGIGKFVHIMDEEDNKIELWEPEY